ncbi:MAG: hypothetical protein IIZ38_19600 [Sphingomonas sp.]|uniref:hypothetical protein n=1 Tax=unclassified Sphingomonas TaxID=196159 RepID=UPI002455FE1C|nr:MULTISPECIES: hypothetical protein [unclassified Sphingomonas]MBQ1500517.1 hypothetical protein [Sphingomonas sp.]MDH4745615.1 hypothetical protein [Sphingomonas sp. CBMAI 2297]
MKAGRPRRLARRSAMPVLAMLALAGCDRSAPQSGTVIVPAQGVAAAPSPAPKASAAPPATDHIERLPGAAPTAAPPQTPPAKMQVRKDFTDPPLPAELNDDGGLKPLPPPPSRAGP